jgi:hypothetical protein
MICIRTTGTGNPLPDTSFSNWSGDVQITPTNIFEPTTVDEVVAIVKQAEERNLSVHPVGSGWSFNDNFSTSGFSSGTGSEPGYLVRTDSLNRILSNTMGATTSADSPDPSSGDPVFQTLTGAARAMNLVHVEAGIKVHILCDTLNSMSFIQGTSRGYGFAVRTLGGSGGQSISGAISTSTHGGDIDNPPLPDMVMGIHLVAPGGAEFFIQRGGARAIVDTNQLAQAMPCVAGRIISNDDVHNAVLVSMGRMGIIYSMVLAVDDQFVLNENRFQANWNDVGANVLLGAPAGSGTVGDLRANNYFLEIVILPYANSSGDRDCFVTTRSRSPHDAPLSPDPNKDNLFSAACRLQPLEKSLVVVGLIAAAAAAAAAADAAAAGVAAAANAAAAALAAIPFVGEAAAAAAAAVDVAAAAAAAAADAAAVAVSVALTPLLVPSITIGDYIATVTNLLTDYGLLGVAKDTVNGLLSSNLGPHTIADLSYKVMDTYDYQANCYKARSLEVAFDADQTTYVDYVNKVFQLIDNFASQNILYGGYISLRYCGKSEALLAIEQWTRTVCIEMSTLSGLNAETQVLNAFEAAAAQMGAAIHWGQLNNRTRPDIEAVFAGTIQKWRQALVRLGANGNIGTFDNDFCSQRGLEPYGTQAKKIRDLSYIVPLLLG